VAEILPGHVHQLVEATLLQIVDVKQLFGISHQLDEDKLDSGKQPSDVLVALIEANRELSRLLDCPATPSDVHRIVSLAAAYTTRITNQPLELAAFEHKRRPADCYVRIEGALATVSALIGKRGQPTLAVRGTPEQVVPADCFELAHNLLGEIAYLHGLTNKAAAVQPFEPCGVGHRLPGHVHQLVRSLESQLATL